VLHPPRRGITTCRWRDNLVKTTVKPRSLLSHSPLLHFRTERDRIFTWLILPRPKSFGLVVIVALHFPMQPVSFSLSGVSWISWGMEIRFSHW
jgi:hypothetical protein